MENRVRVGDEFLITGPSHFEKATVISREKGVYLLNNQMKLSRDMTPINSKLKVERFNQLKYDYLVAKGEISKKLRHIQSSLEGLLEHNVIKVNDSLTSIIKELL